MLSRDFGCRKNLLWRVDLEGVDVVQLAETLSAEGWRERSSVPQVRDMESPAGHGVVLVPRTGRIQIRIHYLTPHEDREQAARAVAHELEALGVPD